MVCPKCNSENVNVSIEQVSGKTKARGTGCLWDLGRWTLIICTCGLWLLVGKRTGSGKMTFKSNTVAVCQNCGHKWKVG
jgi:hypothetical protein